jgi:hypothetical protein
MVTGTKLMRSVAFLSSIEQSYLEVSTSNRASKVVTTMVVLVLVVIDVVVVVLGVLVQGNGVRLGSVHVDVAVGEALQQVT